MKKLFSLFAIFIVGVCAVTANAAERARRSVAAQMVAPAPRATASTNQITAMANANAPAGSAVIDMSSIRVPVGNGTVDNNNGGDGGDNNQGGNGGDNNEKPDWQKQKEICLNNNIGVGNTYVWASRYSNTDNYASMIEDVENPENNVCFVLVEIKSADPRISVSDVPDKYFQMGQNITCGSWADAEVLRQRILDAKKSGRTWATVGGAVGGAGLGVGAMELFGNRLIGGSVMGQKQFEDDATGLLVAQLRALKNQDAASFNEFMYALDSLAAACNKYPGEKPAACSKYDYKRLQDAKK